MKKEGGKMRKKERESRKGKIWKEMLTHDEEVRSEGWSVKEIKVEFEQ